MLPSLLEMDAPNPPPLPCGTRNTSRRNISAASERTSPPGIESPRWMAIPTDRYIASA